MWTRLNSRASIIILKPCGGGATSWAIGAAELDLAGRQAARAELVLQPADAIAVGRAVRKQAGHEVETRAPCCRAARLGTGGHQRDIGDSVAAKPFEAGELDAIAGRPRHSRCRPMSLPPCRSVAQVAPVQARPSWRIRSGRYRSRSAGGAKSTEDISDGTSQRGRAVQGDVRLGQEVAHGEGQQEGLGGRPVIEADDTVLLDLPVRGFIAGIAEDAIPQSPSRSRLRGLGGAKRSDRRRPRRPPSPPRTRTPPGVALPRFASAGAIRARRRCRLASSR